MAQQPQYRTLELKDPEEYQRLQEKGRNTTEQLRTVEARYEAKGRDKRRADLTLKELRNVPDNMVCYQPVGRMYIKTPLPAVRADLKATKKKCQSELTSLESSQKYLSKQLDDTRNDLQELFKASM